MHDLLSNLIPGRLWNSPQGSSADGSRHGLRLARATYRMIMYIERGCRVLAAAAARLVGTRSTAMGRSAPGATGEGP